MSSEKKYKFNGVFIKIKARNKKAVALLQLLNQLNNVFGMLWQSTK